LPDYTKRSVIKMIKAVLFDFNGVIMDDLEAVARANCDIIQLLGGKKVKPSTWFKEINQEWQIFFMNNGVRKEDISRVLPLMKDYYPKYEEYIKLREGVEDVLRTLSSRKIKAGILSGNEKQGIVNNLRKHNIEGYFSFVISGGDVKNPKPHPEGLEKAILFFKIKPTELLYVDDMPTIFNEAKRLGIRTIGFKSKISGDLSGADVVIEDMRDVLKHLS
jgi:phosphoglycolate phosphatase/pyrophosphatase PpaX